MTEALLLAAAVTSGAAAVVCLLAALGQVEEGEGAMATGLSVVALGCIFFCVLFGNIFSQVT